MCLEMYSVYLQLLEQLFSTCGFQLLWGSNDPFTGHLRPLENTDIYIMIHNSDNHSYEVERKGILWLGVSPTRGTVLMLLKHQEG